MANYQAITKHIVTSGNYAMVPAGQRLFDCPNCKAGKGGKIFFNVAPGQLVAYTISATTLQPVTVDSTNVATITGDLYIGVGIDADGDGAADDVRLLAGEKIDQCKLDEVKVSAPVCGQPQILGAYLDCVKCWETYAAQFRYSDNRTRSFGKFMADQEEITVSIAPECSSCTDCPQDANCEEVVCGLVDALNGEFDLKLNPEDTVSYPDRIGFYPEKPYRAVRLHDNWFTFCISPTAAACDCEGCIATDAIQDMIIDGTTVTFSGNLNPADNTQTYLAQLKNIAQQIECGFEDNLGKHTGFAFVTGGGPDKCCDFQLHVVTCDDTFELHDVNGQMTPCDTAVTPYPDFVANASCIDCGGDATTTTTPTCGLAVIVEQPSLDCDCFIEKPLAWYGRTGDLTFIKDLDSYSPIVKATELLAPQFPENFGAWVRWLEYSQETGGRGRQYRDVNAQQGWLGVPDRNSRARKAISFADCNKSYCTYYLGHSQSRKSITKSLALNKLKSFIHIPSDDGTTLVDWEAFFNALLDRSDTNCHVLGDVTCGVVAIPTYIPASYSPSYEPTYAPNYGPAYIPSYAPTYAPNYAPVYTTPTYTPVYTPVYSPVYTPIYTPVYTPNYVPVYIPNYTPT